ncbi:MAG: ABC transporter permease [Oscillospiraceae bacterium]|nr:ABC transporter permease [Oscillospiraceae bacterium]
MLKTIFPLAFEGIKRRKRQSILIFFVLLVSFTFAIILLSYTSSIAETNSQLRLDTYGSWYGAISDGIDGDLEYLESTDFVDDVGTSVNYGKASVMVMQYAMDDVVIGTADDSLIDMGINLESGSMPDATNEIAIESATLSEIDYNIGGTITLQFVFYTDEYQEEAVTVERTFKVVGAISEYTGLWSVDCTLNSAIITKEAMAEIVAEAEAQLGENMYYTHDTTYFFTVKSGMESSVESDVNKYLYSIREGSSFRTVTINPVTEMESEAAQTNMVYLGLILAITILAVVMIYILQMQVEVKRIVRFRSIGGSKGQLRFLILTENLMLAVPAMILGILFGLLGIRIVLGVSVYSGSVDIAVSMPWSSLIEALALWIVGILAVRMITFQVALATPLVGRMGLQRSKAKLVGGFRRALIMLMATLLCVSAVFTTVNIAEPASEYNYWSSLWSYYICQQDGIPVSKLENVSDYEDLILSAPGISDFIGFNSFDAIVTSTDDGSVINIDGRVIAMEWEDIEKYVDTKGVDREAFESGESVIVQVVSTSYIANNSTFDYSDITLSVAYEYESVERSMLSMYDPDSLLNSELATVTVDIDSLQIIDREDTLVSQLETDRLGEYKFTLETLVYYVICSNSVIQNLVNQIPENTKWWTDNWRFFRGQQEVGYQEAYIFVDMNAGDLSADAAMTNIINQIYFTSAAGINENYFELSNLREINYSNAQVYQQSMIMTIISGVCIAVVVLLILVSTLRLETESEKKRYGILQAIGMSKRQRNIELARRAVVRSIVSIAIAIGSYLCYYLAMNISAITAGESAVSVLGTMFATLAGYGLTAPVLIGILIIVFLITFAICFGSKMGINKYSIMEMLRND